MNNILRQGLIVGLITSTSISMAVAGDEVPPAMAYKAQYAIKVNSVLQTDLTGYLLTATVQGIDTNVIYNGIIQGRLIQLSMDSTYKDKNVKLILTNPDGVELEYARENANGIDIESGWDDNPLEPEVLVLKNRFIELMAMDNPVEVALNMHSAYSCKRYFVYHDAAGTSDSYTNLEQQFIGGIQSYFVGGIENWDYFVSWTSGTPDQYPESWWWMNQGENVMALTYEDMNCVEAGSYDSTAYAIVRGIIDYLGLSYTWIEDENNILQTEFSLSQNFPNPFNPRTNIRYSVSLNDHVKITVFDLMGHEVKTLLDSKVSIGSGLVQWDGRNFRGEIVPSGVYIYSVKAGEFNQSRKMIILK